MGDLQGPWKEVAAPIKNFSLKEISKVGALASAHAALHAFMNAFQNCPNKRIHQNMRRD
jgi:hypothetical protein